MNTTLPGGRRVDGQTHAGSGRANGSSRVNDKATQFEVTLKVTAPSEQLVTDYCITHLRDRGYSVRAPNDDWESVKDFMARLKILCHTTIGNALRDPACPPVMIHRGSGGRLIKLKSNDLFEEFVLRNKA